jgi:glutaredoxin/multisubunit Na+/H+ antiporter MnhC subunit
MKRFLISLSTVLFSFVLFLSPGQVKAAEADKLNIYLFYGDGCPHCAAEKEFFQSIYPEYEGEIQLHYFELYYDSANQKLVEAVAEDIDSEASGVPYLVIGDEAILGYFSDETTGEQIRDRIDHCLANTCQDKVSGILSSMGGNEQEIDFQAADTSEVKGSGSDEVADEDDEVIDNGVSDPDDENDSNESRKNLKIDLPILGQINTNDFSLPVITILIAFFDGFNPCAMWILLFLISMLIHQKDVRRRYILGFAFITASAFVYFLFLASWLEIFKFIKFIDPIKKIIGLIAISSGVYHLYHYINYKPGCNVVPSKEKNKIFDRIKNVVKEQSLVLALIGIVIVAFSVNLVELVCSAGLPAIYTQVLSLSDMPRIWHYAYLFLYIIIFMLDDMVVFILSMKALKVSGLTNRYTRISNLLGGILIFILGILMFG